MTTCDLTCESATNLNSVQTLLPPQGESLLLGLASQLHRSLRAAASEQADEFPPRAVARWRLSLGGIGEWFLILLLENKTSERSHPKALRNWV